MKEGRKVGKEGRREGGEDGKMEKNEAGRGGGANKKVKPEEREGRGPRNR